MRWHAESETALPCSLLQVWYLYSGHQAVLRTEHPIKGPRVSLEQMRKQTDLHAQLHQTYCMCTQGVETDVLGNEIHDLFRPGGPVRVLLQHSTTFREAFSAHHDRLRRMAITAVIFGLTSTQTTARRVAIWNVKSPSWLAWF